MNSSKLVSVMIGAAAGGAVAYLLLTDSGKETLKKITSEGGDLGEKVKAVMGDFLEKIVGTSTKETENTLQEIKEAQTTA